jgi:hypothetical protein
VVRERNLLTRAKANDPAAIATMFKQFVPPEEPIEMAQYMGVLGMWGIGTHRFAGVTARRFVSLRTSLRGGVTYQDGSLEYTNSALVHQPSKLTLYLYAVAVSLIGRRYRFSYPSRGGDHHAVADRLVATSHRSPVLPVKQERARGLGARRA